jgi:hypothetical protein
MRKVKITEKVVIAEDELPTHGPLGNMDVFIRKT